MKKDPGKEARAVPAAIPGGGRDDEFPAAGVAE
jgi:hypothetical protein